MRWPTKCNQSQTNLIVGLGKPAKIEIDWCLWPLHFFFFDLSVITCSHSQLTLVCIVYLPSNSIFWTSFSILNKTVFLCHCKILKRITLLFISLIKHYFRLSCNLFGYVCSSVYIFFISSNCWTHLKFSWKSVCSLENDIFD